MATGRLALARCRHCPISGPLSKQDRLGNCISLRGKAVGAAEQAFPPRLSGAGPRDFPGSRSPHGPTPGVWRGPGAAGLAAQMTKGPGTGAGSSSPRDEAPRAPHPPAAQPPSVSKVRAAAGDRRGPAPPRRPLPRRLHLVTPPLARVPAKRHLPVEGGSAGPAGPGDSILVWGGTP